MEYASPRDAEREQNRWRTSDVKLKKGTSGTTVRERRPDRLSCPNKEINRPSERARVRALNGEAGIWYTSVTSGIKSPIRKKQMCAAHTCDDIRSEGDWLYRACYTHGEFHHTLFDITAPIKGLIGAILLLKMCTQDSLEEPGVGCISTSYPSSSRH